MTPATRGKAVLSVVIKYEAVFSNSEDLKHPAFWEELFLLWPTLPRFNKLLHSNRKNPQALLFLQACSKVLLAKENVQALHALQYFCSILLRLEAKDTHAALGSATLQNVVERLCHFLVSSTPLLLRRVSVQVFLAMLTASPTSTNPFLSCLLRCGHIFDAALQCLADDTARECFGSDALVLLALLVSYQPPRQDRASANPYQIRLSILDDELCLGGYARGIRARLAACNARNLAVLLPGAYAIDVPASASEQQHNKDVAVELPLDPSIKNAGILSSLSTKLGSLFFDTSEPDRLALVSNQLETDEEMLLALYQAVHLNRNFMTALTTFYTSPVVDGVEASSSSSVDEAAGDGAKKSTDAPATNGANDHHSGCNLLATFVTYCSVVLQNLANPACVDSAHMCMIALTCIVEDQYANSLMHDVNMTFRVPLYRVPTRHRRTHSQLEPRQNTPRPMACAVLDLCCEFIRNHLMRSLPHVLHARALGVIHRLLCYQKKCKVRLVYTWRDLLSNVIRFVDYLTNNAMHFSCASRVGFDYFDLLQRALIIINLCVTYGDMFLQSAACYDEFYYELIRASSTFRNLHNFAKTYCEETAPTEHGRTSATRMSNSLFNILTIISHFQPKIDELCDVSLTEAQVMQVIRDNYDSLSLRLQGSLDSPITRTTGECQNELRFFGEISDRIVQNTKNTLPDRLELCRKSVHDQFTVLTD